MRTLAWLPMILLTAAAAAPRDEAAPEKEGDERSAAQTPKKKNRPPVKGGERPAGNPPVKPAVGAKPRSKLTKASSKKPAARKDDRDWAAGRVVVIPIEGDIDLGLAPFVERVTKELTEGDTLVLQVDTFGGRVDAAVRIRDALLGASARTVAFVDRRAISAGALISLAADIIAMTPGGTIGAATPVQMGSPQEGAKPVSEKVVSYMRKEMKATAEAKGRRPDIAEAMVDADVEIEGLIKTGKVLTLTTEEALEHGIALHKVADLKELFEKVGLAGRDSERIEVNWAEKIARALTNPAVSSLLMTFGFLGLLMGLYSGGNPVILSLALSCLGLFFFGHLVVRLAGWEEMALFFLGVSLLLVELLVIPGFGIVGVGGLVCIFASLLMALVELGPIPLDVSWASGLIGNAITQITWALVLTVFLAYVVVRTLPHTPIWDKLMLATAVTGQASTPSEAPLVNQLGRALTDLRPSGKVEVGGKRMDAQSEGPFVEKGSEIRVTREEIGHVVVRRA